MIPDAVKRTVEARLGARITGARRAPGGSINAAFTLDLDGGPRAAFLKTNDKLPSAVFEREAEGLAWLAEAGAVSVPGVLAVSRDADGAAFLVLERIDAGRGRTAAAEERLGHELALLHRFGAPSFGFERDNFLATLPQDNAPLPDWPAFYRARRLEPLVLRAERLGLVAPSLLKDLERLLDRLPDLAGPPEPPARLHGDLWAGNWLVDAGGRPFVVDPAVYGGHREIDLAMMRLFGGFGARTFAAYEEAFPLAPGHADRVALWQLYPVLAHVVMFGAAYVGQLEELVGEYA